MTPIEIIPEPLGNWRQTNGIEHAIGLAEADAHVDAVKESLHLLQETARLFNLRRRAR